MKPKKRKHQKPIVHTKIPLSVEDQRAVYNALDFMAFCKSFSYEDAKIDPDCAFEASEKLSSHELTFTRGELRASAKAIEFAIHCLIERCPELLEVSEDEPELIPELEKDLPSLLRLNPMYQELVSDLKKFK